MLTPSVTAVQTTGPAPTIDVECDRADFLGDVTIVDNAVLHLGESFTKTWRVRNAGICPWTPAYKLVFVRGDRMGTIDSVPLPAVIAPNQTLDIPVNLSAPDSPGQYQSYWLLQNPDGANFGIGPTGAGYLWVKIRVIAPALPSVTATQAVSTATPAATATVQAQPTATPVLATDFVAEACSAQWQANDGILDCPGQDGDPRGFVLQMTQADLEGGTSLLRPTLLTFPSAAKDGYILGLYPQHLVAAGDHFRATVGCAQDALACSVLFRLSYLDSSGAAHDLWSLGEFYDGKYYDLDLDLAAMVGQQVRFVLSVNNLGDSTGDRALWVAPRIVHLQTAPAPIANTPTASAPTASLSPSVTPTVVATSTSAIAATSTPTTGTQNPPASISQIIDSIAAFFRRLFGGQ